MFMPGRKYSAGSEYRYGFNGQEKSYELGEGFTNAEYWEYDSRIGRRWNVDPVVKPNESSYLTFSGNPISLSDRNGDCAGNPAKSNGLGDVEYLDAAPTLNDVWNNKTNIVNWLNVNLGNYFDGSKQSQIRDAANYVNYNFNPIGIGYNHYSRIVYDKNWDGSSVMPYEHPAQDLGRDIILFMATGKAYTATSSIGPKTAVGVEQEMAQNAKTISNTKSIPTPENSGGGSTTSSSATKSSWVSRMTSPPGFSSSTSTGGVGGIFGSLRNAIANSGFKVEGQLAQIFGDKKLFSNWLKSNHSLSRISNPLNANEAQQIISNAKNLGLPIESNLKGLQGLEKTGQWGGIPHFKVGNVHIPIGKGLDGVLKF